jgi:hypothetical protein
LRSDLGEFAAVNGAATGMGCLSSGFYETEGFAEERGSKIMNDAMLQVLFF